MICQADNILHFKYIFNLNPIKGIYACIYNIMILTREDKQSLLNRFPSLELSYENVLHKKVCADLYMLIPKGQKSFAWFTYWQENNYCFILLLNDKNNICDITPYPVCFDSKLSLGTVLYGTVFRNNNLTHFSCEDVFYYKGANVKTNFLDKLVLLKEIFDNNISQSAYTSEFLVLGLPIIKNNYDKVLACINGLSYKVYGVQMYGVQMYGAQMYGAQMYGTQMYGTQMYGNNKQDNNILGIYKINTPILSEAIFNVKPLLDADIYELYTQDQNKSYGIALVSSYKSSVMLNSLFRHIKENCNLDLLEESDDEEYENTNISKFVDLDKTYKMRCVYIKKFRKWQPIEVVDSKMKVSTYKEIQVLENTFFKKI